MACRRDVSPIIQKFRDFLLMRKNVNMLRFKDDLSERTQPPPALPEGPHHKLAGNYYYTRDARRVVKPSQVLAEGQTLLQLHEGGEPPAVINRVPGKVYHWDT